MQISPTMSSALSTQTIQAAGPAIGESTLALRTFSAAGSAISFLATAVERCGAFGLGFAAGLTVMKNHEGSFRIAVISLVAFTCLNVLKFVLFGPSAFFYSAFNDSLLGGIGVGTGFVAGLIDFR